MCYTFYQISVIKIMPFATRKHVSRRQFEGTQTIVPVTAGPAGEYTVDINGLTGRITVISPDAPQPPLTEVNDQTVGFEVTPRGAPLVKATGWFIGAGIITLAAVLIIFIARLIKRRKSGRSSNSESHS